MLVFLKSRLANLMFSRISSHLTLRSQILVDGKVFKIGMRSLLLWIVFGCQRLGISTGIIRV